MELSVLAGNPRIKELLSHREEGRGLSHAYILSGAVGTGRHTLANLLAQSMVCSAPEHQRPCGRCKECKKAREHIHPDIITVSGADEGKPISVDQVRQMRSDSYIRPNEAQRKVYLLENADKMNASAQNAMLKLLEEGPGYAAFLLIAENGSGLLQTVRSRCEMLELDPVPVPECQRWLALRYPDRDPALLQQAALDCQGILGRAVEQLEGSGQERAQRQSQAEQLAQAMEQGDELTLFQASMALEKLGKGELAPTLEALENALAARLLHPGDRRRLLKAVLLVKALRQGAAVNANPGQLAGWLCAGMFL